MARDENPPFGLGKTFGTTDATVATHLEGKEYTFEDVDVNNSATVKPLRTGRYKRVRIVRNTAAVYLKPKRLVTFEKDGKEYGGRVDGYATTDFVEAFPVDEYLSATGVTTNDLFYITVDGPALCQSGAATVDGNTMNVGDRVWAQTGAASNNATTAGRIDGAGATTGTDVLNVLGRALTAVATSGNVDQDVLVDIGKW